MAEDKKIESGEKIDCVEKTKCVKKTDCGEKTDGEEKIYCPNCGLRIPVDSVYCEHCGAYVPDEDKMTADEPKAFAESGESVSVHKKIRLMAVLPGHKSVRFAAGLAGVICALLCLWFLSSFMQGSRETEVTERYFYVKDNSLYGRENGSSGEAEEYSAAFLEKWGSRSGGGLLSSRVSEASSGGKPADDSGNWLPVSSDSGEYLFYPEKLVKGSFNLMKMELRGKTAKTLDSGVTEFIPAGTEDVVYRKENGALYWYGGNRKRKLTKEALQYWIYAPEHTILWTEEAEGVTDLYYEKLSGSSEKVRLERNVQVLDVSTDRNSILVKKEDQVYLIRLQAKERPQMLADEVGQVAAADAKNGTFYLVRDVNRTPTTSYRELYYYADGKEKLLTDDFQEFYYQNAETVIYKETQEGGCFLAYGGVKAEMGREPALPGQVKLENGRLYFMSADSSAGEGGRPQYALCYVDLNHSKRGSVQEVDDGISELACISDGKAYYYKDTEGAVGDLYCDGVLTAYDVAIGTATAVPGRGVLCIADYSAGKRRGTLLSADGEGGTEIAYDVSGYLAVSQEEVLLLSDYNFEKERGNLLRYDGNKVDTVDTDIWSLFGTGIGRICR